MFSYLEHTSTTAKQRKTCDHGECWLGKNQVFVMNTSLSNTGVHWYLTFEKKCQRYPNSCTLEFDETIYYYAYIYANIENQSKTRYFAQMSILRRKYTTTQEEYRNV